MEGKDMICIVCPMGCKLQVKAADAGTKRYIVEGNKCARGAEYGVKELTNPTRVITSTVRIKNALLARFPVKIKESVPKNLILQCMKVLEKIEVSSPVRAGDIIKNILGTGVDIIAARSM